MVGGAATQRHCRAEPGPLHPGVRCPLHPGGETQALQWGGSQDYEPPSGWQGTGVGLGENFTPAELFQRGESR